MSHSASWVDLEKLMLASEREKEHGSGTLAMKTWEQWSKNVQ